MASADLRGNSNRKKPSQPVIVLVDMDGVVADLETDLLDTYRSKYPDLPYIKPEDRRGLYANIQYEDLQTGLGEKIMEIIRAPKFYRDFSPIGGAIEAVKEMSAMENVEVYFCTSALPDSNYSATDKLDWITQHFGQIWTKRVIMANDKTLVQGDLLIDDKVDITGTMETPTWKQVLFTSCHNTRYDIKQNPLIIARLDSWADREVWKRLIEEFRLRKSTQEK